MRKLLTALLAAFAAVALAALLSGCGSRLFGSHSADAATKHPHATRHAAHHHAATAHHRRHAHSRVAAAHKRKNRCSSNSAGQKVIVDIAKQHAWMCARHRTVYSTAVTTGMTTRYTHTPHGHFTIEGRDRNSTLTLDTGQQYHVRYWIPFQAPLYGFHDASWQKFPFGSPKYRTDGSHGCVHMPLKAMRFLYRWAARPTKVHIY